MSHQPGPLARAIASSQPNSVEGLKARLAELEQALAHERGLREAAEAESDKWFAIAAAEQDVKALLDRNVKLRQWLESSDGMMANYERLASKYKHRAEAAEAAFHTVDTDNLMLKDANTVLRQYASRLLAALTQQRQALKQTDKLVSVVHDRNYDDVFSQQAASDAVWAVHHEARAALATDHAALVSEGTALGVEQKAQEGP